jgi:hypothetical protein
MITPFKLISDVVFRHPNKNASDQRKNYHLSK